MSMLRKTLIGCAVVALALAVGCSKTGDPNGDVPPVGEPPKMSTEPVTLICHCIHTSEVDFQNFMVEPLKTKYPHITLLQVTTPIEELMVSGTMPDMMRINNPLFPTYKRLQILQDLTGLVKQHGIDLSIYDEDTVETVKLYADNGELWGLPYMSSFSALFYNADLFDQFGVEYPQDGLSWDDAIELSKRVSRTIDGVTYSGLEPWQPVFTGTQLSLQLVDPDTDKPLLNTDGWRKVFQLFETVYAIPDNPRVRAHRDAFLKDQNLAMLAEWGLPMLNALKSAQPLPMNWDLTTMPYFPDNPGRSRGVDAHYLTLSAQGKNQDVTFHVITYLTSDYELNRMASERGFLPALVNPDIIAAYGKEFDILDGKNIQGVFAHSKPAMMHQPSNYDVLARGPLTEAFNRAVRDKNTDINTALREADEKLAQLIAAEKAK